MLKTLYIKNYALIDELDISWNQGLTAITGETGAGKSIIIGALQLATGQRADSKVIRVAQEKCIIEASFQVPDHLKSNLMADYDLDDNDEILLRREIYPTGKSRCFVNDSPKLLSELEQIGKQLLVIHQQFDHLDFYDRKFQLDVLDNFAGNLSLTAEYKKHYDQWNEKIKEKKELELKIRESNREKEFLSFQLNELNQAKLQDGELSQLEQDLLLTSKADDLNTFSRQICDHIQSENGIIDQLQNSLNLLKTILLNDQLQGIYNRMEQVKLELADLSRELEHIADHSESNPERLLQLQSRVDLLNSLLKKHKLQSDTELIALRNEIQGKLDLMEHSDEELEKIQSQILQLEDSLKNTATQLSIRRKKTVKDLQSKTTAILQKLGMEFARFEIQLTTDQGLMETGSDVVEFLFSANKGNSLKALKDQSSGGELARFNLAIKSLIAGKNDTGCLIFDEIDTGVSGQIALQMGNILKDISTRQQVICITHSPQVASRAPHHYYVYKQHQDKSSETRIKILNEKDRIVELAKMLSGEPPSKAALSNASELLQMSFN
ncbi:MAG: DNA repair protein RecN [Saprospiraceae bacterium]|nr:DNA repair protein RecN [Saprospiraceae bacterium]